MYKIDIHLKSINVIEQLTKAKVNADFGLRKGLYTLGKSLEKTSKLGIKIPPKTGRYYLYKGRRIQASAPNEYPANRSGVLRNSISFIVIGDSKLIFGAGVKYSSFLELGTVKMKQRPFLKKSINTNNRIAETLVGNIVKKELIK